jgi:hypothetical protein
MTMRSHTFFLTLLVSGVASAQALPKYEIHESMYTANANAGLQTEYQAKVIDRATNILWLCVAYYPNNNTKQLSGRCIHAVSNTAAQPNLAQLVTAESISANNTNKPAQPLHWWLINHQTGAVFFCWGDGCTAAPYQ